MCGGAEGVDTYAANIVADLKRDFPQIQLKLILPYQGFNVHITDAEYLKSIASADEIVVLETESGRAAFMRRNRYMVEHSERLIAVYDEKFGIKSGTYRTLKYAK